MRRTATIVAVTLAITTQAWAVSSGQIDTFDGGNTLLWLRGAGMAGGGPGGAGDGYLQLSATGGSGANSNLVTFNQAQWAGDYAAAGIAGLSMWLNNNGNTDLYVRIALGNDLSPTLGGTWAASQNAIHLTPGSGWAPAFFGINAADLTIVQGPDPLGVLLSGVTTLRILHATGPSAHGGAIPGELGIDNVKAEPIPEPASLALLGAGGLLALRRRCRA